MLASSEGEYQCLHYKFNELSLLWCSLRSESLKFTSFTTSGRSVHYHLRGFKQVQVVRSKKGIEVLNTSPKVRCVIPLWGREPDCVAPAEK